MAVLPPSLSMGQGSAMGSGWKGPSIFSPVGRVSTSFPDLPSDQKKTLLVIGLATQGHTSRDERGRKKERERRREAQGWSQRHTFCHFQMLEYFH